MEQTTIAAEAICEIGPVSVRRLTGGASESRHPADPVLIAAALDCGDPLLLVGTRPMAHDDVWQAVLERVLCADEPAVLVHPSWWPAPRVDAVYDVAGRLCADVDTRPRSWLLAAVAGRAPVVEIGPQIVAVTVDGGVPSGVRRRAATPDEVTEGIVRLVLQATRGGAVWIDAPSGVPGGDALAAQIADRLKLTGRVVHRVGDRHLFSAAATVASQVIDPVDRPHPADRRRFAVVGLAVTAALAAGLTVAGTGGGRDGGRPVDIEQAVTAALVEGHVTTQIPAGWTVRRITAGPGSARVEVVSPIDGEAVLHLTQAPVRDDSLAAAAAMLRRAMDAERPGIFVDFHPTDERAGRPAITYREIRPGHDIRWAVILDGAVRIGIGCQSGIGLDDVASACDEAIRSAHEIR